MYYCGQPQVLLTSAAKGASWTTPTIALQAEEWLEGLLLIDVGAVVAGGGAPTLDLILYTSHDGISWYLYPALTIPQIAAAQANTKLTAIKITNFGKYIGLYGTYAAGGGAGGSIVAGVRFVGKG